MRAVSMIVILFFFSFAGQIVYAQAPKVDEKAPPAYRIQQGDKLSVKFFNNTELNEPSAVVRPDGYIGLQLIDDIRAEGLTVAELKGMLEKAYDETLLTPIISVTLVEFVQPHIYIAGQVTKPGRYTLREARTMMQAIFIAGGFTREANRSLIIHARPNGTGDWRMRSANAMNIINQKGSQKDIELRDGDYLFIPDSKLSQFNRAVESFRGLLPRFF